MPQGIEIAACEDTTDAKLWIDIQIEAVSEAVWKGDQVTRPPDLHPIVFSPSQRGFHEVLELGQKLVRYWPFDRLGFRNVGKILAVGRTWMPLQYW